MRVAEPEFAFRCGTRLAPRAEPYTVAEAVAAMDALIPAIEVPDSRFEDFAKAGAAQLIADCACARDLVLGVPATAAWRWLDLAEHKVHGSVVGRIERDGIGRNVLDDPRLALAWLVNELSSLGFALEPGEVITTGTCMPPLAIEPGDRFRRARACRGTVRMSPAPSRHRRLSLRSRAISRAALWPGTPVTPPPGWAPEPQR
jgi:2-keto-4-pentenoate hydratase